MRKLFDAMSDYTPYIWEKPEEALMFIQTNIIRLKSPDYIGLCLNDFNKKGAVLPTTMKEAKTQWDNAINRCKNVDDVIDLAIKICKCFDTQPHWNSKWNCFLSKIQRNHNKTEHIKAFLLLSNIHRLSCHQDGCSKDRNQPIKKILSSCKELQHIKEGEGKGASIDHQIKLLLHNFQENKHKNRKSESNGALLYHADSLYSLMLGKVNSTKRKPGTEFSDSDPVNDCNLSKEDNKNSKSTQDLSAKIMPTTSYDTLVSLGLTGCKIDTNPYVCVLKQELNTSHNKDDVPHIDAKAFLNSFSLDTIDLDKLEMSDRAHSKYIIERLSNINFIYSLCNLIQNTPDSHFKKAIVEVTKFLVLYPLVAYRVLITKELESLINEYNSSFSELLYAQFLRESPDRLLELLSDEEIYQFYMSMNSDAKKEIDTEIINILGKSERDERRDILKDFTSDMLINLGKKLLGEKKVQGVPEKELFHDILGLSPADFAEATFDICSLEYINLTKLISVGRLRYLLSNLKKETLQTLLSTAYKDKILLERLQRMPFNGTEKSLGKKDLMVNLSCQELSELTWNYMPEEFLAIILYHSFVYFPILTYVFHACLAVWEATHDYRREELDEIIRMKFKDIDKLFTVEKNKIKNKRYKNSNNKNIQESRMQYSLIPKVHPQNFDEHLNSLLFDVYSIYYESKTGPNIDPIDLTECYLSFYYRANACKDAPPCDPINWFETYCASLMLQQDNPFTGISSTNTEGEFLNFNELKWREDSNGGLVMQALIHVLRLKYHNAIDRCLKTFAHEWYPSISYLKDSDTYHFRPDSDDPYKQIIFPYRPQFF